MFNDEKVLSFKEVEDLFYKKCTSIYSYSALDERDTLKLEIDSKSFEFRHINDKFSFCGRDNLTTKKDIYNFVLFEFVGLGFINKLEEIVTLCEVIKNFINNLSYANYIK